MLKNTSSVPLRGTRFPTAVGLCRNMPPQNHAADPCAVRHNAKSLTQHTARNRLGRRGHPPKIQPRNQVQCRNPQNIAARSRCSPPVGHLGRGHLMKYLRMLCSVTGALCIPVIGAEASADGHEHTRDSSHPLCCGGAYAARRMGIRTWSWREQRPLDQASGMLLGGAPFHEHLCRGGQRHALHRHGKSKQAAGESIAAARRDLAPRTSV